MKGMPVYYTGQPSARSRPQLDRRPHRLLAKAMAIPVPVASDRARPHASMHPCTHASGHPCTHAQSARNPYERSGPWACATVSDRRHSPLSILAFGSES